MERGRGGKGKGDHLPYFPPLASASNTTLPIRQVVLPAVGIASNANSCGPRFETEAVFTYDRANLTFDLSTSKWSYGNPCNGLPSCQFPFPT